MISAKTLGSQIKLVQDNCAPKPFTPVLCRYRLCIKQTVMKKTHYQEQRQYRKLNRLLLRLLTLAALLVIVVMLYLFETTR